MCIALPTLTGSCWGPIQYKDAILPVWKPHCGDKTILRPSYLHNGISYTGKTIKMAILY